MICNAGATSRRDRKRVADLGGTLGAFYFVFKEDDVYVIANLPTNDRSLARA